MATLLPDKIYQNLRRKLLAGAYPPGSKLEYKGIGAELGVSPTPVREAMAKLASDGFVELIPRAGAIVCGLEQTEFVQLYGVREAIETYAAARAARKISAAGLRRLEVLLEKMRQLISKSEDGTNDGQLAAFVETDMNFHMTIIEAAGNPMLTKLAGDYHVRLHIACGGNLRHDTQQLEQTYRFHRLILLALKNHNAQKTGQLTARHIRQSLEIALADCNSVSHEPWWQTEAAFLSQRNVREPSQAVETQTTVPA